MIGLFLGYGIVLILLSFVCLFMQKKVEQATVPARGYADALPVGLLKKVRNFVSSFSLFDVKDLFREKIYLIEFFLALLQWFLVFFPFHMATPLRLFLLLPLFQLRFVLFMVQAWACQSTKILIFFNQRLTFHFLSQIFLFSAIIVALNVRPSSFHTLFFRVTLFLLMKLSFWLQNELGPFQTSAFSNGWERNESKTIRPLPQRLSRHSQMLNILFSAVLVFYIPFLPETPLMHLDIVDWAMMMSSLVIKGMALVFVCFLSFPFLTTYTAKTYSSLVFRVLPFVLFLLGFGTLFMVGPV